MASTDHRHLHDRWQDCTLCSSHQFSLRVLEKAARREVHWPQPTPPEPPISEESVKYTTLDEAFSNLLHALSSSSRQCKRYYKSAGIQNQNAADKRHCGRFHNSHYTRLQRKHPLETQEAVHLQVAPGTYAVTAGGPQGHQQTHMVNLQPGQTVELDFCI